MPRRGESALLLLLALFLTTGVEASNPLSLEKKLKRYLDHRLLVFRQLDVHGTNVRLNSRGQLVNREKSKPRPARTGILYLDLKLKPERLLLLGEPAGCIQLKWPRTSSLAYQRSA